MKKNFLIIACIILILASCVLQNPENYNDKINTFVITNIRFEQGQKNTCRYTAELPDNQMSTQIVYFNDSVGKFILGDAVRFTLLKQ